LTDDGPHAKIGARTAGEFDGRQTRDSTFAHDANVPRAGYDKVDVLRVQRMNTACLHMRWVPKSQKMKMGSEPGVRISIRRAARRIDACRGQPEGRFMKPIALALGLAFLLIALSAQADPKTVAPTPSAIACLLEHRKAYFSAPPRGCDFHAPSLPRAARNSEKKSGRRFDRLVPNKSGMACLFDRMSALGIEGIGADPETRIGPVLGCAERSKNHD